jgi:hypothetical protein
MLTRRSTIRLISGAITATGWSGLGRAQNLMPPLVSAIAKEAFIYGYPMVMNYGNMFAYAIARANPQYKAPFNEIANEAKVFTPQNTTVAVPNLDTPYSTLWADLRAQPLILGVPTVDPHRYYSIMFVDLYTWNFAYVGTRTTGNGAGYFLLAGPGWDGVVPTGITKVIRADTDFVFIVYRTQLFDSADLVNVKEIQSGFTVQALSRYQGRAALRPFFRVEFPPFIPEQAESLTFFSYLAFLLQFCPVVPGDEAARARFAQIGIEPGRPFNPDPLAPDIRKAIVGGMEEGLAAIRSNVAATKTVVDLFGTREYMKNSYLNRATGAMSGIYGDSKDEVFNFAFYKDTTGQALDGSANRYTIRFDSGQFPPVNAFWAMTLYEAKTRLLTVNPINRYLINSRMLPNMVLGADGSLTIYIQKDSPGRTLESNWLPAPDGLFFLRLRCYWPDPAILGGRWVAPEPVRSI